MKITGAFLIAVLASLSLSGVKTEEVVCNYPKGKDGFLACPRNLKPMCGTDGNSYANECDLCNAKQGNRDIEMQHEGKCTTEEECELFKGTDACNLMYYPVCASDNRSRGNKCQFCAEWAKNPSLSIVNYRECQKE
ncbi:serine protease inhibitor Kazal-type 1-like [Hyperolius riggenbachi]|uniref:serine protease inhibitor Kazal-type 1-like n=1 Tax=Hyperolius riggenbachi TaxID=752182 RepID=UPI0035A3C2E6